MLRFLRNIFRTSAVVFLTIQTGCDQFPLAIQNQTKERITVEYATLAGKCDLTTSETLKLAPGERFAIKCAPVELLRISFAGADGRCALSKAGIARVVREEKGFKGSFLLPFQGCSGLSDVTP